MALTPEEEKRLREQIRNELRERERRMLESKQKEETNRQKNLESRIRQQIVEEEEERYFTEQGYVKYVNRYGGVEWLIRKICQSLRRCGMADARGGGETAKPAAQHQKILRPAHHPSKTDHSEMGN
jgi:hypothetical protein